MSIEGKHAYRFEYLKSEQWSNVRIEALAREKGKCQICGEESIHNDAHHIWYPESVWDTKEHHLVILCRACHEFIHTMMPECKTGDESEGQKMWARFKAAILCWRLSKCGLFEVESVKKVPALPVKGTGATLRQNYDLLKYNYKRLLDILKEYREEFGDLPGVEAFMEYRGIPKPKTGDTIRQEVREMLSSIKKWALHYEQSEIDKLVVDNQDFQI